MRRTQIPLVDNLDCDKYDITNTGDIYGKSGGITIYGGSGSGDDLNLYSSSHATKGNINFTASGIFSFDEANGCWSFASSICKDAITTGGNIGFSATGLDIRANLYFESSVWKYYGNGYGALILFNNADACIDFRTTAQNASGAGATATLSGVRLNILASNGNVGIGTAAPSRLLDVNQGGGNMIADGYDSHCLGDYKENIVEYTEKALDKVKNIKIFKYKNVPFVSTHDLVVLAMNEFKLSGSILKDARGFYKNLEADSPIRIWIDNKREEIRAEKRPLEKERYSIIADDESTITNLPEAVTRGADGEVDGYNLNTLVTMLLKAVQELTAKVAILEAQ